MSEDQYGTGVTVEPRLEPVPAGRREQIAAFVGATGPVSVRTLASRFRVSNDTVRRDLDQLASEGRLVRTHGGAMAAPASEAGSSGTFFETAFTPAKREVGALAATLISDGDVLMVNAGATPVATVQQLGNRRELTIVTNNLLVAPAIPPQSCRFMYVLGGEVRLSGQSTVGSVTQQLAGSGLDIRADLALVSIGGVTVERGYSVADLPEAVMMNEMIKRAAKVAILADSSKFGRQLFANVAELGDADYFVTDAAPPEDLREALIARGVRILTPAGEL